MKTPEQVMTEAFEANWNLMTTRQLMVAAIEADREQRSGAHAPSGQVEDALRLVDEARNQEGLSYGTYSRLYDAILSIEQSAPEAPPVAPPTSSLSNRILDNYRHSERERLPFTRPERWLENLRNPMPGAWYYATQAEVEQAIVVLDRLARVRRA